MNLLIIGFFLSIFLFFPRLSLAVTTSLTNPPASITSNPFTVQVSITGASTGTNHLRIDLYKDGTTNYFGETFNGTSWYSGSDPSQYFPITIQSGATASATFQGKVGNTTVSQYTGSGTYKLRIRRYTSSGSYTTSEANNSAAVVLINVATPTPSPSPSPIPTQGSTATPVPTDQASPSPTASVVGSSSEGDQSLSPNPTTVSINLFDKATSSSESVLPASTKSSLISSSPKSKEEKFLGDREINFSGILIGVGIVIIIGSLGFFLKSLRI